MLSLFKNKDIERKYNTLKLKATLLIKEKEQKDILMNDILDKLSLYEQSPTTVRRKRLKVALEAFNKFKLDMKRHYYPNDSVAEEIKKLITE